LNTRYSNTLMASAVLATVLLKPFNAVAAVDLFLKIDGVQGESVDVKHKGEIDVVAWGWGESKSVQATPSSGSSAGKGVACISDLKISKYIDEATPHLITSTVNNDTFASAKLTVRKPGPAGLEFFTVTMTNVSITSYATGATLADDRLTENIMLHFNSAVGQYVPQSASGTELAPVTWSVSENGGLGNPLCP
jgi:type VI secretion system secreted protein Hcp